MRNSWIRSGRRAYIRSIRRILAEMLVIKFPAVINTASRYEYTRTIHWHCSNSLCPFDRFRIYEPPSNESKIIRKLYERAENIIEPNNYPDYAKRKNSMARHLRGFIA